MVALIPQMNTITEELISIDTETRMRNWTAVLNYLAGIEGIWVNKDMLNNVDRGFFPCTTGRNRSYTSANLIKYKNIDLYLGLYTSSNFYYLKIFFREIDVEKIREKVNMDSKLVSLILKERDGHELTKEEVAKYFTTSDTHRYNPYLTVYLNGSTVKEDIAGMLEKKYELCEKHAKYSSAKALDKIYNSYLKTRYPLVVKMLADSKRNF